MNSATTSADGWTAPGRAPPDGTIERWCFDFIVSTDLSTKLSPARPPALDDERSWESTPKERCIERPGRPAALRLIEKSRGTPHPEALAEARSRGKLFHLFAHHELQAAELFAWALLRFPTAPRAFRAGLVRLCAEELTHLKLYLGHMRELGTEFGAYPVRDWFWDRVPACASPAAFVALQGLGLEGANLDHTQRFASQFRAAGDERGARILEHVDRDEIGHVLFAKKWFEHFSGAPLTFEAWRAALPAPLTPAVLQGRPLNRDSRTRAGFDAGFLDALAAVPPVGGKRPK
ncbi:MAG: DUF455 family protein [Myxococcales bacterium]|nr:DUF455 family protein [Myxococcales bacterium]